VADFPFHKLSNPDDARSTVVRDSDDVVGSQVVFPRRAGMPGTTQCTKAVGEAGLDPIQAVLGPEALFSQAFDPLVLAGQIGSP
jgi:hypothetical protein